jgi:hypothetical protein
MCVMVSYERCCQYGAYVSIKRANLEQRKKQGDENVNVRARRKMVIIVHMCGR